MNSSETHTSWHELFIFSIYRIFLTVVLFFSFYFNFSPKFLGSNNPELYATVSFSYLILSFLLVVSSRKKVGLFETNAWIQLIIDIVFITLIINASGGLQSSLGSLLIVVVVAGGSLVPGRLSLFIAAMATLAVLLETSYSHFTGDDITKYSNAGLLGAVFFATAAFSRILSNKMKESENLAEERAKDVKKLETLNIQIINRMQTGIIVIDKMHNIILNNQSASTLLGKDNSVIRGHLQEVSFKLSQQVFLWGKQNNLIFDSFQVSDDLPEILIRCVELDDGEILIYLDSVQLLSKQSQQLKLVSLGRLTASIAHEIRNPLGAISHAGELLAENHQNDTVSTKLTDIIQRHSARMNTIIETILQMGRHKTSKPINVHLPSWLTDFRDEFCEIKHIDKEQIELILLSSVENISMDAEQLHQIIWNLIENAWQYSVPNLESKQVKIQLSSQMSYIVLDVFDNGPGVSKKMKIELFEPFNSDRQGGTGLGLYLARELCQSNNAHLSYFSDQNQHYFRVQFSIQDGFLQ